MPRLNQTTSPNLHLEIQQETCLCCGREQPIVAGEELCASCVLAAKYVEPVYVKGKKEIEVARCKACPQDEKTLQHPWADMYTSRYLPLDFKACHQHAIVATLRFVEN